MKENVLLIVDGNALASLAYFVSNGKEDTKNKFLFMLKKTMRKVSATHLFVAFDHPEETFRHIIDDSYKLKRKKDKKRNEYINYVYDAFYNKYPDMVGMVELYEGDDIIATVVRKVSTLLNRPRVIILSPDKDLLQLIDSNTDVILWKQKFINQKLVNAKYVEDTYGLKVSQLFDYFCLIGDVSDSVRGIPGIGKKTAVKLLQKYGTIENILKGNGKAETIIKEQKEELHLAQTLIKLYNDVRLKFDLEFCELQ